MKTIKFITRVYSDRPIERPEAYFRATFGEMIPNWFMVDCEGSCLTVESRPFTCKTDKDTLDKLYQSVTPEMYESTSRSFVVLR